MGAQGGWGGVRRRVGGGGIRGSRGTVGHWQGVEVVGRRGGAGEKVWRRDGTYYPPPADWQRVWSGGGRSRLLPPLVDEQLAPAAKPARTAA